MNKQIPGLVYTNVQDMSGSVVISGRKDLRVSTDVKSLQAWEIWEQVRVVGASYAEALQWVLNLINEDVRINREKLQELKYAVEVEKQLSAPECVFDERDTFEVTRSSVCCLECSYGWHTITEQFTGTKDVQFSEFIYYSCFNLQKSPPVDVDLQELRQKGWSKYPYNSFSIKLISAAVSFDVILDDWNSIAVSATSYQDLMNSSKYRSIPHSRIQKIIPRNKTEE